MSETMALLVILGLTFLICEAVGASIALRWAARDLRALREEIEALGIPIRPTP